MLLGRGAVLALSVHCRPCPIPGCLLQGKVHRCSLHCIEWRMREQALRAKPRLRGPPKNRVAHSVVADNVLDHQF